jgi:anti-sigma factor RsiW
MTQRDDIEFELSQYLDGELSRRRARRLERRLEEDASLHATLQQYALLEGRLASLGEAGLAGADYDSQRAEIVRRLERQKLLSRPTRRTVFLRPVFALSAGGLAVAATILLVALLWRGGAGPVLPAAGAEVAVMVMQPAAPAGCEASVSIRRLEDKDIRIADATGDLDAEPSSWALGPPPGTVMVSFSPTPGADVGGGMLLFSVE